MEGEYTGTPKSIPGHRTSANNRSERPYGLGPTRLLSPWNFPGKSTGVGCHFLLQGIFPTQGSNPGLPHYRQTLYLPSHQGSPLTTWLGLFTSFPKPSSEGCRYRHLFYRQFLQTSPRQVLTLDLWVQEWRRQVCSHSAWGVKYTQMCVAEC